MSIINYKNINGSNGFFGGLAQFMAGRPQDALVHAFLDYQRLSVMGDGCECSTKYFTRKANPTPTETHAVDSRTIMEIVDNYLVCMDTDFQRLILDEDVVLHYRFDSYESPRYPDLSVLVRNTRGGKDPETTIVVTGIDTRVEAAVACIIAELDGSELPEFPQRD